MPDGSGLLVLDSDQASNYASSQIVFVSYPEGKLNPITRDTNNYFDLSVASNGQDPRHGTQRRSMESFRHVRRV